MTAVHDEFLEKWLSGVSGFLGAGAVVVAGLFAGVNQVYFAIEGAERCQWAGGVEQGDRRDDNFKPTIFPMQRHV